MLIAAAVLLTSCSGLQVDEGKKGQLGAVSGAVGGAVIGQAIGHNTEATLIGAAVGTMLGYMVGNEMDKYDRSRLNQVYEHGVSGRPSSWVNPDTGNSYQVTPQPARRVGSADSRICREAEIIATIDGRQQKTFATACRDAAGRWLLQN